MSKDIFIPEAYAYDKLLIDISNPNFKSNQKKECPECEGEGRIVCIGTRAFSACYLPESRIEMYEDELGFEILSDIEVCGVCKGKGEY